MLFVCTGNSSRSPIAEARLRHRAPADAATPGRNRIHLVVDDLDATITRLRDAEL